ncbi:MAG: metal-sensitive transcriptional regulator [Miltoncostaeaceae bacterium]
MLTETGPEGGTALRARLRRAEGQLRGVQRMLDEGADSQQILTQLAAVKAAVDQVGLQLMSDRLRSCVADGESGCTQEFEDAMATFLRFAGMAR